MSVPRIVVTQPLCDEANEQLALLAKAGKLTYVVGPTNTEAEPGQQRKWLLDQLRNGGVNAIICLLVDKIDEEVIESAGDSLKVVSSMSAGFDHINLSSLSKRQIALGTVPDTLTESCADIGAALVLASTRRVGESMRAVLDGKWPNMPWTRSLFCGRGLQGMTIGILGFGKIGQLTLKRLLGFGIAKALYTTSKPGVAIDSNKDYFFIVKDAKIPIQPASSLEELGRECDVIIVTAALTLSTNKIISSSFLSGMKEGAYLVNISRGALVDNEALLQAIQSGHIAGAGLDVVDGEPNIGADHPLVKEERIVIFPHIGSATLETRNAMSNGALQNCLAGLGFDGYEWLTKSA